MPPGAEPAPSDDANESVDAPLPPDPPWRRGRHGLLSPTAVNPPWWKRRWARSLGGGIAVLIVLGVIASVVGGEGETTDLLNNATTALDEGRWGDAEATLTELIDLSPEDVDTLALAYVNRAFALGNLGRFEEAEPDLRALVELLPASDERAQFARDALKELGAD